MKYSERKLKLGQVSDQVNKQANKDEPTISQAHREIVKQIKLKNRPQSVPSQAEFYQESRRFPKMNQDRVLMKLMLLAMPSPSSHIH